MKNHEINDKNKAIYTKKELAKLWGLKHQSRISTLLKEEKIVQRPDGKIDLNHPKNASYHKLREVTVPLYTGTVNEEQTTLDFDEEIDLDAPEKNKNDLDIQKQRLIGMELQNKMLELKHKRESKELVEFEVVKIILTKSFEHLFTNLLEYPDNAATEIVNIVKTQEDAKLTINEKMKNDLRRFLDKSLSESERVVNKFYDGEFD